MCVCERAAAGNKRAFDDLPLFSRDGGGGECKWPRGVSLTELVTLWIYGDEMTHTRALPRRLSRYFEGLPGGLE